MLTTDQATTVGVELEHLGDRLHPRTRQCVSGQVAVRSSSCSPPSAGEPPHNSRQRQRQDTHATTAVVHADAAARPMQRARCK